MRNMNPMNLLPAFRTAVPSSTTDPLLVSDTSSSIEALGNCQTKEEGVEEDTKTNIDPPEKREPAGKVPTVTPTDLQDAQDEMDEQSALLGQSSPPKHRPLKNDIPIIKRIASAVVGSCRLIVAALLAPGRCFVACFYDEDGHFSMFMPFLKFGHLFSPPRRKRGQQQTMTASKTKNRRISSNPDLNEKISAANSDSEADSEIGQAAALDDTPARNTRSRSSALEGHVTNKSIRIKAASQDELRQRKQRRQRDVSEEPPLTVATIKSPTSAAATALALTKYPRAPAPPRPLIPRRQPSYSTIQPMPGALQKTLIIDLDETLIHSMAKGGRMSTGHMVEVKLSTPVGVGGSIIAPQVPILYYVHKRPYCDEFLRKVGGNESFHSDHDV